MSTLAKALEEKQEAALVCSGFQFESTKPSWMPLFYVLMPASFHGGAALLMFRCDENRIRLN